jgi:two-component system chemotaxis response regulator CheB
MNFGLAAPAARCAPGAERIRVMLADDAVVVRGTMRRWIEAEPDMQIVSSVHNGREAIEQVQRRSPDIVILDVTMPDMDGIAALPRLLQKKPDLTVLMVSALTRRNAEISLHALSLGAADYIPKPDSSRELSSDAFRRELIDKVRALVRARQTKARAAGKPLRHNRDASTGAWLESPSIAVSGAAGDEILLRPFPPLTPRVLLIGGSTGAPQALTAIVSTIGPVIDAAPVLVAQHMPPTFTAIFAEHLARASGRPAAEAAHGQVIRAGRIYVAPGGLHMRVMRRRGNAVVALDDDAAVNFCKPSVDPLLASAATTWGAFNLALILTGMGSDGARGAAQIVSAGGSVIVQDEASSVVWGMPGTVAEAGLASAVLPLDQIGAKISWLFAGGRS